MKTTIRTAILTLVIALAMAPAAFATDDASTDAYGGSGGDVLSNTDAGTVADDTSSGELPFTGLDLAFVGMAGIALLGLGFGLRRASRANGTRGTPSG